MYPFLQHKIVCKLVSILLCTTLLVMVPTPQQQTVSAASGTYSQNDVMVLAKMIYGEARGESYVGQVAVGARTKNFLTAFTAYAFSPAPLTLSAMDNITWNPIKPLSMQPKPLSMAGTPPMALCITGILPQLPANGSGPAQS